MWQPPHIDISRPRPEVTEAHVHVNVASLPVLIAPSIDTLTITTDAQILNWLLLTLLYRGGSVTYCGHVFTHDAVTLQLKHPCRYTRAHSNLFPALFPAVCRRDINTGRPSLGELRGWPSVSRLILIRVGLVQENYVAGLQLAGWY